MCGHVPIPFKAYFLKEQTYHRGLRVTVRRKTDLERVPIARQEEARKTSFSRPTPSILANAGIRRFLDTVSVCFQPLPRRRNRRKCIIPGVQQTRPKAFTLASVSAAS